MQTKYSNNSNIKTRNNDQGNIAIFHPKVVVDYKIKMGCLELLDTVLGA